MPEDPPVTQSGTERGDPLNVREAHMENVTVTRMNIATGEVKDAQTELLTQVRDNTRDTETETASANDTLQDMANSLRTLVREMSGEGGTGGALADIRRVGEEFKHLNDELESTVPRIDKWGKLFVSGTMVQFNANMRELNESVFRLAQNMSDLRPGVSNLIQETKDLFETSKTGMVEISALWEDVGAAMREHRDTLQSAVPVIKEMADQGIMTMGILGSSAREVAAAFHANRQFVERAFGPELLGRIPMREQNEILTRILHEQRRANVQGTNRDILQSRFTREQLEVLRAISFSTGKQVEEIIKLQEPTKKTLAEMELTGLISKDQRERMSVVADVLQQSGLADAQQLLESIVGRGGIQQGLVMAMRETPIATFAAQGINQALLQEAIDVYAAAGDPFERAERIRTILAQLTGLQGLAPAHAAELRGDLGTFLSAIGQARAGARGIEGARVARRRGEAGAPEGPLGFEGLVDRMIETDKSTSAEVTRRIVDIQDFLNNNLGPKSKLALALGLQIPNILKAILLVLGGGAVLKGGGALLGGLGGLARGGGRALGGILGGIGLGGLFGGKGMQMETPAQAEKRVAAQAGKIGGKALGRSILKKITGISILAGIGFGLQRLMQGDVAGAGLEVASGITGTFPGLGTAASIGLDASLAARDIKRLEEQGQGPIAGPPAAPPPAAVPADNPFLAQLTMQTDHLTTIIDLLTTANEIGTEMVNTIGDFSPEKVSPPLRRARREEREPALFSDLLAGA